MTTHYEKKLENRVEDLENRIEQLGKQLEVSEKQAVRDFNVLKEILLKNIQTVIKNNESGGPTSSIPIIAISNEIIDKLEDEEIKKDYKKLMKSMLKGWKGNVLQRYSGSGAFGTASGIGVSSRGISGVPGNFTNSNKK